MPRGTSVWLWVGVGVGVAALVIILLLILRWYLQGRSFTKDVRIDGKVIIVTGCNTGIGRETVLGLARRGGKVYMACRDTAKCDVARDYVIRKSGNKNVFTRKLDLASQDSIREFVTNFHREESQLHILINNAGIMMTPRWETKEGIESQLGVNHIGHFLLTTLLLDTLKASAPSRIVVLSSIGHTMAGALRREDWNWDKSYNKYMAYFQSKLANVLFSRELSKRLTGTGVTVNSLHPGAVRTELNRSQPIAGAFLYPFTFFFKSATKGAQTSLTVALDPALEGVSGKYFDNCRVIKESDAAQDDEAAVWLWTLSEQLTKQRV